MTSFRAVAALAAAAMGCCVAVAPAVAQQKGPQTPQYIVADKPAGVNLYAPGAWGILGFGVYNPTTEAAEVLAAMHFEGDNSLQYGRQLWIPPRARRFSWYPIQTPDRVAEDKSTLPIKALLLDRTSGDDQFIASRSGQMLQAGLLTIEKDRPITGVLADSDDLAPRRAVVAARLARDLSWRVAGLDPAALPPIEASLDALDQLVITSDSAALDGAGMLAIRRWLYDGGQLWIMLDEVSPTTIRKLLGDSFRCQVVDRVDLTEFQMQGVRPSGQAWQGAPRTFDEPVEMIRAIGADVEITHSIDGWPAAFWQQVGSGRVLYTTLAARGWTRERTADDARSKEGLKNAPVVATEPLDHLATEFFQPGRPPVLAPAAFDEYVGDQIGYAIVSRGPVVATLGSFCLVVLGLGVWLQRRGRLEMLGWIGPLVAVGATIVLAVMGVASRRAVPPTVAIAQFAEVVPGAGDLQLHGTLAIYNQDQSNTRLGATAGGIFMPDMTGQAGTTRRMVWTDFNAWHWENLTLPAGVRLAPFSYATKIAQPLSARATLGSDGLTGQLIAGPFSDLSDAIIATPARRALAVRLDEQGEFQAGMADVLPPGQYLGGNVVSDRQVHRQVIFHKLLDRPNQEAYPAQPALLFWAAPLEMHFHTAADAERTGAALLVVPLELERPPVGTQLAIPAPLVPFQSVSGPGRAGMSAAYQNREGQWIGPLFEGSETFLRFQLPEAVLPVRLDRAVLRVKINASGRTLEIMAAGRPDLQPLATRDSPLGVLTFEIDDPTALQLDERGGLLLAIRVGDAQDASGSISSSGWTIDYVQLEAFGETVEK